MVKYIMKEIENILAKHHIFEYGICNFDKVKILNPKLLPNSVIRSVLFILMPYRTGRVTVKDGYNMGLFARIRDYHGYFAELSQTLIPQFEKLSGGKVYGFADHSPIDEKAGASLCGLGFIGRNSLLINPRYGSYVFIGCYLFTEQLEEKSALCVFDCGSCHLCADACPTDSIENRSINRKSCLSAVSQKKAKTDEERAVLKHSKTVWGCDICQSVCPYNKNAELSPINRFDVNVIENISAEIIEGMDEEAFKSYAFSFRSKKVIIENLLTDGG